MGTGFRVLISKAQKAFHSYLLAGKCQLDLAVAGSEWVILVFHNRSAPVPCSLEHGPKQPQEIQFTCHTQRGSFRDNLLPILTVGCGSLKSWSVEPQNGQGKRLICFSFLLARCRSNLHSAMDQPRDHAILRKTRISRCK